MYISLALRSQDDDGWQYASGATTNYIICIDPLQQWQCLFIVCSQLVGLEFLPNTPLVGHFNMGRISSAIGVGLGGSHGMDGANHNYNNDIY
jgi:hypothetical protein